MTKIEKKIIEFIEKNKMWIFLSVITILALIVRYKLLTFKSDDYIRFLKVWFDFFRQNGFAGLKNYPGDYNAPYMTIMALLSYIPIKDIYLIKGISIVFDIVLAVSAALLVKELVSKDKKWLSILTYIIVLFLPQIILNGSFWGQCDSMYTSFCILALYFLVKEKYIKSFIFLGLAFAFKLQFIFILPIFIILYFSKKKFSLLNFLIIPGVNFVLCIPALIVGKPIIECLTVYFKQTKTYENNLTANFINIYQIVNNNPEYMRFAGLALSLVICIVVLYYTLEKKIKWNNEKIITLTLWFLIVLTYTLPCMHERYLFIGEILSIIYYICYRKNGSIVALININAIITYSSYLFGSVDINYDIMAIIYLVVILYFSKNTYKLLESDSKE